MSSRCPFRGDCRVDVVDNFLVLERQTRDMIRGAESKMQFLCCRSLVHFVFFVDQMPETCRGSQIDLEFDEMTSCMPTRPIVPLAFVVPLDFELEIPFTGSSMTHDFVDQVGTDVG